jgi:hypothetical protein
MVRGIMCFGLFMYVVLYFSSLHFSSLSPFFFFLHFNPPNLSFFSQLSPFTIFHSLFLCTTRTVGQWAGGKKHGPGRYTFASGDFYDGDFFKDKAQVLSTTPFRYSSYIFPSLFLTYHPSTFTLRSLYDSFKRATALLFAVSHSINVVIDVLLISY